MPDGGVVLARTTPEAIASAIIDLLDNEEKRNKMSAFGINYMKDYPLEKGFAQFLKAVDDMLNTDYDNREEIKPVYNKPAFEASKEASKVAISQAQPFHIDNRGPLYRFLRRVKRKIMH